jgi:hypothetical protein
MQLLLSLLLLIINIYRKFDSLRYRLCDLQDTFHYDDYYDNRPFVVTVQHYSYGVGKDKAINLDLN